MNHQDYLQSAALALVSYDLLADPYWPHDAQATYRLAASCVLSGRSEAAVLFAALPQLLPLHANWSQLLQGWREDYPQQPRLLEYSAQTVSLLQDALGALMQFLEPPHSREALQDSLRFFDQATAQWESARQAWSKAMLFSTNFELDHFAHCAQRVLFQKSPPEGLAGSLESLHDLGKLNPPPWFDTRLGEEKQRHLDPALEQWQAERKQILAMTPSSWSQADALLVKLLRGGEELYQKLLAWEARAQEKLDLSALPSWKALYEGLENWYWGRANWPEVEWSAWNQSETLSDTADKLAARRRSELPYLLSTWPQLLDRYLEGSA